MPSVDGIRTAIGPAAVGDATESNIACVPLALPWLPSTLLASSVGSAARSFAIRVIAESECYRRRESGSSLAVQEAGKLFVLTTRAVAG